VTVKALLAAPGVVLAPGVYDGLSSLIASRAGAKALYLSGASIAYSRFGNPDLGLVDMTEVGEIIAAITDRVDTPLIADADNGYGNALNVKRTMRTFERAGAAAIQLEDQTLPKRCGHLASKSLVSQGEMVGKVKAACDSRTSSDTLVIARTDAIAVEGLDAALERAHAYADAGADVIFGGAATSVDDMRRIVATLGSRVPLLANMVEGGKTPVLSTGELSDIGYKLAIFPGSAARAIARQMQDLYGSLVATGSTEGFRDRMFTFRELNEIIGTEGILRSADRYA